MRATQIPPTRHAFPQITRHALQRAGQRYGRMYDNEKKEGESMRQWLLLRVIRALEGVGGLQPTEVTYRNMRMVLKWDGKTPFLVTVKNMKQKKETGKIIEHDRSRVGEGFLI